jgi:hypothetical protein
LALNFVVKAVFFKCKINFVLFLITKYQLEKKQLNAGVTKPQVARPPPPMARKFVFKKETPSVSEPLPSPPVSPEPEITAPNPVTPPQESVAQKPATPPRIRLKLQLVPSHV